MPLIQHYIGYRIFALLDTRNTDEQERRLEAALRAEFIALVPVAGRLRAGELVLQRHHTEQGCRLEYFLVLPPQTQLDLDGVGCPPPDGTIELQNFGQDVATLKQECATVRTRLILSQSPAIGHRELAQATPVMVDTKALRGLCRRQSRQVALPSPTGDLLFDLPAVPARLPGAMRYQATAQISKITPAFKAHLRALEWDVPAEAHGDRQISLPKSVIANRKGISDTDAVHLLKSMDGGTHLTLSIKVEFDWATGAARDFKIEGVSVNSNPPPITSHK